MMVLAFDTALGACSVGVWRDGALLARDGAVMPHGHAEALMPMIARVMTAAGVSYAELDRIAVTVGPGSFTGLRVGIAAARGLAMAAGRPAVGIATTEALAAAVPEDERRAPAGGPRFILSVIDSKRGDVFAQAFDAALRPLGAAVNVADAMLGAVCPEGPVVVVGDAAARAQRWLGARAVPSRASALCDVAALAALAAGRAVDARGPLPLYVRAPDVTLRPDGGVLRP
jgi:tRNA threonylcarbamoyladenosine biosynthesis protein TsaB